MKDTVEVRKAYCNTLIDMAKKDDRICVLEADLMSATGTKPFKDAFPERTFDVGIAEANMVGVASGLCTFGKIPFVSTFTPFLTRRALDQIEISVAYAKLNVKLVGTDPGISAQLNGGTHMSFDDMGIMRGIPTMVVFEPTDATMVAKALPQIAEHYGPVYIRMYRKITEKVYDDNLEFDLFKSITLKDGNDATIIASGMMVPVALEAYDKLKEEGIDARVIDMHTWKPLDEEAVYKAATETGAIVTAENHSIINGLGSAVSEYLAGVKPTVVKRIGVKDQFGEVGKEDYLFARYELTADDIVKAVKEAIALKKA